MGHKRRYFEECCDNQTVFIYIDFPCMDKNSMDVNENWKYLLQSIFFHVSQKSYRFGKTCAWVNFRIFIFGWTIPLKPYLRQQGKDRNLPWLERWNIVTNKLWSCKLCKCISIDYVLYIAWISEVLGPDDEFRNMNIKCESNAHGKQVSLVDAEWIYNVALIASFWMSIQGLICQPQVVFHG